MELEPSIPKYETSDRNSFAYCTVRDRWPVILTSAIDDVHRSVLELRSDETEKSQEGKSIIEKLAKLKYEIQHDRQLTPLQDDGKPDIAEYNAELEKLGNPSWFNAIWLYAECYLYRRVITHFALSKRWKEYDVFARQKVSSFRYSRKAVTEMASRYQELVAELEQHDNSDKATSADATAEEQSSKAEELLFTELCEFCLWGNATDLSLLTNLTFSDIQKLQGSDARKSAEKNILVNDISRAFGMLRKAKADAKGANRQCRVDIALDNAGFELFVDLVFAGFLVAAGLATNVVLHVKQIPWFVSDATPTDLEELLRMLSDPQSTFESKSDKDESGGDEQPFDKSELDAIYFLYQHWTRLRKEEKLELRHDAFWHQPGGHVRMVKDAPQLYQDLKQSELVIFKGDLHYRKLTSDAIWSPTTPFPDALGSLGPGSGIRALALRTCKSDVVVGLSEGEDEWLKSSEDGGEDGEARKWAWSGKWALAQYCDGK